MAAGLGAGAAAALARLVARDLELGLDPRGGVLERDLEVVLQVLAAPRPRAPAALAAAEEALEEVLEDRAEARRRPPPGPVTVPKRSYCARLSGSDRTVYASLTSLKRSSAALSPGLLVGVVHPGELAVGLLQLRVVGVARDAEDGVVILGRHLLGVALAGVGVRVPAGASAAIATVTIAGRSTRPSRR